MPTDRPFPQLVVIIPANNEEGYIEACLQDLLAQTGELGDLHVIVAANACTDQTVPMARGFTKPFAAKGYRLECLDLPQPGKVQALNAAENSVSAAASRVYLDADVRCDPDLMMQLRNALSDARPLYATGTLSVAPARTWITRQYARLWQKLPFVQGGAVGAGLFAMNATGRQRWDAFPDIISDDTFVRLQFEPDERIEVAARYHWPMIEGFQRLVRVRGRQDAGVAQIKQLYPQIMARENKTPFGLGEKLGLALRDPIGFAVYTTVHLAVRLVPSNGNWTRGR